jgi:hypothetical protein
MSEQPQDVQSPGEYEPPAITQIASVNELTAGTDTFSPTLDDPTPP